ncbi:glycosyltransferase [Corynebacterium ammoniagenes]|uniref:glycosyltransferase n=1 Tax=Corynebacterium ammoniagenes TaxID=1697 RepID=UPI0014593E24|nr:glycosyltransferase [Corynebacterium ammoniagenes]NMF31968.1 glycosyltransferase [Corynebacterium ammoniagenes]
MGILNHVDQGIEDKRKRLQRLQQSIGSFSLSRRFLPGVSVIVPCYQAARTLEETLHSLYAQSLDFDDYEVIVIFNGADDGSYQVATDFSDRFPELNLRLYLNAVAGAGAARNVGLNLVRHANTTFVDADDLVEREFLKTALDSMPIDKSIVASPIHNLDSHGVLVKENALNSKISACQGQTHSVPELPWLLGFNACKLIPSELLLNNRYSEKLKSGEDLVFFANLLSEAELKVVFPDSVEDAAYIRRLSDNSVSRQSESFEFNVKQRVECLAELRQIEVSGGAKKARIALERAQVSFVQKFLDANPEFTDDLDSLLVEMSFLDFPWNWINDGRARDLAFSYCFVPYADTSAVIAAKAISERRRIVDVVSANMSEHRKKDASLRFLCSRWLDKSLEVSVPPSFADWNLNIEFARKAVDAARKRQEARGANYETLYSRALWMGSHVAGALFKIEYPETVWTAEFSDPLRFDVEGNPRLGTLPIDNDSSMLLDIIESRHPNALTITTVFDLVEASTMILADELLFTNRNQLEYMLSKYPKSFADEARAKARVREHPSPRQADYQVAAVNPGFSTNKINIAYFGAFYVNRGLGDVFTALQNLKADEKRRIAVHIYCQDTASAKGQVIDLGLSDVVHVHPYLPYLQFLNSSAQADVLLVNDVQRSTGMDINPFLPSKYSDYKASGSDIWGVLDPGSPLSTKALHFKSENGDVPSSIRVLKEIIEQFDDRVTTAK